MKGIDISNHNNGLNLELCQKEGAEFAILRGAFTGWGANRVKQKDACFEKFYAECTRLKIPCGCYYYSCADSATKGKEEAEFLYENCLKGKKFLFPIYIDVEDEHWQVNKKQGLTDAICAFCDTLENKGYFVGIYTSTYWLKTYIDFDRVSKYSIWLADWRKKKPSVPFAFDMWQTGSATWAGKTVDNNIAYKDFPKVIRAAGCNGFRIKGDINGDGKVTSADARLAMRAAVDLEKLDKDQVEAGDMNGDGEVTSADARMIQRKAVDLD